MSDNEKKKFKEFLYKFSREQLVGWQSAIAFILPMHEVGTRLGNRLLEMFRVCDEVIKEESEVENYVSN